MISDRLRLLRKEKGLSKRDLVAKLPLNYSTYANYESGFREPNSEVLQLLARHFGVSIDYLLGVSDNRKKADEIAILNEEEHDYITKYRMLDSHGREIIQTILQMELERINFSETARAVVKDLQNTDDQWVVLQVYQQESGAGLGSYLNDKSDAGSEFMRFEATSVSRNADFCVKVTGDSMEPKIRDGDIVFVKSVPKVEPDNVGIFIYEGELMCKRLRLDLKKQAIFMESLNKSYAAKNIQNPDNLRTVGLVIGIAQ